MPVFYLFQRNQTSESIFSDLDTNNTKLLNSKHLDFNLSDIQMTHLLINTPKVNDPVLLFKLSLNFLLFLLKKIYSFGPINESSGCVCALYKPTILDQKPIEFQTSNSFHLKLD